MAGEIHHLSERRICGGILTSRVEVLGASALRFQHSSAKPATVGQAIGNFRFLLLCFAPDLRNMEASSLLLAPSPYPLAPEHPYPAQQLSCYTAVSHFLRNAQDYGVDPKRIVLAGDSSGGTLVASTAQQLLMTKDLPQPRAHILIYPFLQSLDFNLPSYQQNQSIPLLIKKDAVRIGTFYLLRTNAWFNEVMANAHIPQELREKYQKWISAEHIPEEFKGRGYVPFVPGPFSEDLFKKCKRVFDPIFSPLLAEDAVIQQFPETFLLTCEYDIFRDDGLLYKKRLEDNGVPVTWVHLKDGFHGIALLIDMGSMQFPGTRKSINSVIQFLEQF
ncbi:arylacetamide deacetylase-like 3 [Protobothrops mucrosquamatus]|uniref:arylacetamide deacetylase-like 3 n=1 Tax=Protobothrops mucrosquamatus TaxID=103944 RepID=UPI0010FB2D65|nr:arylacetamide deacetylase-like 3 [Protobothrops mucrosquamatus]